MNGDGLTRPRAGRLLVAFVLATFVMLLLASPAQAHAALTSSNPSDGALLDAAPNVIVLTFSEPPDPELSSVDVLNQSGTKVQTGPVTRGPGNRLSVPITAELPDGVYTVSWDVVSEVDGHVTVSAFGFGIGVDSVPRPEVPAAVTPPPSPAAVAGRILLYAGVTVLIAAAIVGGWAMGGSVPARRVVVLAASGALVAAVVLMLLAERAAVGAGMTELLGSRAGRPYVWLAGMAAITAAAGVVAAIGSDRRALVGAGVGAAAVALVRAMGGHAAAAPTPLPQVALQWVHVVAISSWIGGLVLLALRARDPDDRLASDARRFSQIAVVAAPLAVVSGFVRAATELGGFGWLLRAFDTSYGTALAIKVTVVAGLLGLGGWNRFRGIGLLRAGRIEPLRRAVLGEVGLAVAILGVTATLTGLPPRPAPEAGPSRPQAAQARASDFAGTVDVTLRASPGTPGPNTFRVRLRQPGDGGPVSADAVALRFTPIGLGRVPPTTLDLTSGGDDWVGKGSNLSIAGTWEVRATVLRGADAVEVPLLLTTVAPTSRIDRIVTPGRPTLTTATFGDNSSLQVFLDPQHAGLSQVHVTAFDANGFELAVDSATIVAFPPSSPPRALGTERFGKGHFVSTVQLVPGPWRFAMTAVTPAGRVLQASFSSTIGEP